MTDRLKPCPFCGGDAEVFQVSTPTYEEFVVTCKNRNCCAFYIGYGDVGLYPTEQKAIEAWNTRKPMDRVVEQLKEVSFIDWDEEYIDNGECLIYLADAIEIVKEGGKDE